MELIIVLLVALAAGLAGIAAGWFLRFIIALGRKGSMELEIKEMMLSAREDAEKIIGKAEQESEKILKTSKEEVKKEEERLQKTEDRLINKEGLLDKRQTDIDEEVDALKKREQFLEIEREKISDILEKKISELEKIGNLSAEEAKEILLKETEKKYTEDLNVRLQKMELSNKEKIEQKAREILTTSIQRLATNLPNDIFASVIELPSDEVKGKIIGKEGRNIKTFERMTGVELLIDDTPNVITISSFDPIRREVARRALEALIKDGRIQPAKIEQSIEKARSEINNIVKEQGEKAAYECGVYNLDPKILMILGRLYFRTSYGQNVLQHSIEMAHMAGMIAEELGADVKVAKTAALLHDIGKAVDHEVAGSHVEIGRRILQKFNVDEKVIKGMQAHHEEYPFETVESVIIYVTDAISGGRPGARSDNVENYIKRLEDLEHIADNFESVEKAYALQAGREIRVFVKPDQISDLEAKNLAREIALQIEKDLNYPGEIKVTVIRENRIVEYAR